MGPKSAYLVDKSHADGVQRIDPENLVADLRKGLGRRMSITSGRYEVDANCQVRDLDWNHMDHHHRPWVHNTYHEACRVATGNQFSLSITKLRFCKVPVLVQVTDVYLGPGLFYQTFTLFGVFYIHNVIQFLPRPTAEGMRSSVRVDWHIVSHWLLRPLHWLLHKRLRKLNRKQNLEDGEIRERRAELRDRGYLFSSDEPDFVSSNALTLNTRPPQLKQVHRISLADLPEDKPWKLCLDTVEILVKRSTNGEVTVWPGACPHEGADLSRAEICGKDAVCHWHGLRFAGTVLTPTQRTGSLGLLELQLEDDALLIQQNESPCTAEAGALFRKWEKSETLKAPLPQGEGLG